MQLPFPYYDKSRILVQTALNLRNTENFILMLMLKNLYLTHLKIYIRLFHFLENGKKMERMMFYWI